MHAITHGIDAQSKLLSAPELALRMPLTVWCQSEHITLDLDALRSCIKDHVVQTVFPLTEDCVPETTKTLSLAVLLRWHHLL